jgi:hypothetical protein
MKETKMRIIGKVFGFLLLAVIFFAGFTTAVLHLWNWLMPAIFGLHMITYWQALGLLGLSWLLFGGPRMLPGGRNHWRHRMRERWEHMTPEEREKFRSGMRHSCGSFRSEEPKRAE